MTELEASHFAMRTHICGNQSRICLVAVKISLNQDGEVPLQEQIAEQIVFQITTGKLLPDEELPSVRALAQRLKIHHNAVSRAYAALVTRRWLSRRGGSRLRVGASSGRPGQNLDSLIDEALQRARSLGFSIKELEERVIERLSMAAPRVGIGSRKRSRPLRDHRERDKPRARFAN
jgi:GntR family transcriptional regulator